MVRRTSLISEGKLGHCSGKEGGNKSNSIQMKIGPAKATGAVYLAYKTQFLVFMCFRINLMQYVRDLTSWTSAALSLFEQGLRRPFGFSLSCVVLLNARNVILHVINQLDVRFWVTEPIDMLQLN